MSCVCLQLDIGGRPMPINPFTSVINQIMGYRRKGLWIVEARGNMRGLPLAVGGWEQVRAEQGIYFKKII